MTHMSDDMTFCLKGDCNKYDCERHRCHIMQPLIPHSFAELEWTEYYPLTWQEKEFNKEKALETLDHMANELAVGLIKTKSEKISRYLQALNYAIDYIQKNKTWSKKER